jgi:hypothetical protein
VARGTDVARAAHAAGFPDRELVTAVAVAWAESGFNERAVNRGNRDGSTDYGAWQINSVHAAILAGGDPLVLADNARMARAVWAKQGWTAWSVYKPSDPIGYARYQAALPPALAYVTAAIGPAAGAAGAAGAAAGEVRGAAGAGADALSVAAEIAKEPLAVLRWLQQPGNWIRISKVAIGGALVVAGVVLVAWPVVKPVVKTTAAVATKGTV